MRSAAAVALLLAGCGGDPAPPADTPGARLEAAARARGLVVDPSRVDPVGVYATEGDRLCVAGGDGAWRVGLVVDYGDDQRCAAVGTARGRDPMRIDFGGGCAIDARLEADRIAFPPAVPGACAKACTGRASIAALGVERLSSARDEAAAFRLPDGRRPCE